MPDLDFDDRDEAFDEDEMRRRGEPICYCGDRTRRVVKWGMCSVCVAVTEDSRPRRIA